MLYLPCRILHEQKYVDDVTVRLLSHVRHEDELDKIIFVKYKTNVISNAC